MFILKYKKIFIAFSALLVIGSVIAIGMFGLKLGIEFTGGSVIDFSTTPKIEQSVLQDRLDNNFKEQYSLRQVGDAYTLRTRALSEMEKGEILKVISGGNLATIKVEKLDTIGPTLGSELRNKALFALALALTCITLFISYAFRRVSTPVSSWKYGIITMIALIHDIVITIGVFAILGHTLGIEVDALFLTALLVILGYSINDTIVVFDRIRENLSHVPEKRRKEEFEVVVGNSLSQTFVRSLNTTMTTVMSATIIFVLTSGNIKYFALAMIIGMASGAYSSLFVASPLLAFFNKAEKA